MCVYVLGGRVIVLIGMQVVLPIWYNEMYVFISEMCKYIILNLSYKTMCVLYLLYILYFLKCYRVFKEILYLHTQPHTHSWFFGFYVITVHCWQELAKKVQTVHSSIVG